MVFQKNKEKDFQILFRASKIHNMLIIAPNLMKQILVDFLGVDLQYKNIAYKFCDTFLWRFI
jgi:hypothetical protein